MAQQSNSYSYYKNTKTILMKLLQIWSPFGKSDRKKNNNKNSCLHQQQPEKLRQWNKGSLSIQPSLGLHQKENKYFLYFHVSPISSINSVSVNALVKFSTLKNDCIHTKPSQLTGDDSLLRCHHFTSFANCLLVFLHMF